MLYLRALLFSTASCLVLLRFSIATPFSITLRILSIILALCCIPRHLHSYYTLIYLQCVHSVSMVARVDPLANISGIPIACAVQL